VVLGPVATYSVSPSYPMLLPVVSIMLTMDHIERLSEWEWFSYTYIDVAMCACDGVGGRPHVYLTIHLLMWASETCLFTGSLLVSLPSICIDAITSIKPTGACDYCFIPIAFRVLAACAI
jgi:hypothetical protein